MTCEIMNEAAAASVSVALEKSGVVAIIRGVYGDKLMRCARALYDGGIRLMEITYDATGAHSDSEISGFIAALKSALPSDAHIGAGTVTDVQKAILTREAGGEFIISPDVNTDVIKQTKALGMVSMPGALTPTEIMTAHNAGADYIKVFPAGLFGAEYIKAIKAPLSNLKLLAVGNIEPESVGDYMRAGVCGIGVGSGVVNKKYIDSGEYEKLTALARDFVNAVGIF